MIDIAAIVAAAVNSGGIGKDASLVSFLVKEKENTGILWMLRRCIYLDIFFVK